MRPWMPLALAFYTAVAFAQNNKISVPAGGLSIVAGQVATIDWTDPSSSTVTIKLQQAPNITPTSGIVLASGIPASALTASFTIPATVNSHDYTIEIIDDSDPSNYNFSPPFGIQGATGTQTGLVATDTGSASASSASGSSTGSSASSTSGSSASTSGTSSASASSSSASTSASSASVTSSSVSSSQSAATASQTTSAPSSGAVPLIIPGGFLAAILGAAAFL